MYSYNYIRSYVNFHSIKWKSLKSRWKCERCSKRRHCLKSAFPSINSSKRVDATSGCSSHCGTASVREPLALSFDRKARCEVSGAHKVNSVQHNTWIYHLPVRHESCGERASFRHRAVEHRRLEDDAVERNQRRSDGDELQEVRLRHPRPWQGDALLGRLHRCARLWRHSSFGTC